ncbi:MAG: excinuclease ABC subunit UvrC [Bifidobacteriaceae bacterium]|jgi:excinuclease ABC subunit C|nr:excinuclease ABC subunit UvrC [Bifidobacteriaceae bacterium]
MSSYDEYPWRPKTHDIPTDPGVYKYLDQNGTVIYVGKAKNLKNRITSYFSGKTQDAKTLIMLQNAKSVEWTVVSSELEALLLEFTWINEFNPKYNVIFRDDKSYPYLAMTNDEFARVFITRERKMKNVKYFGPYPKVYALKDTFNLFQKAFKFRSCRKAIYNKAASENRPCLLGFINNCTAPCVGAISKAQYDENLKELISFLNGNTKGTVSRLKNSMKSASATLDFENAAKFRDQLLSIDSLMQKTSVMLSDSQSVDVFGLYFSPLQSTVHMFTIRHGRTIKERQFIIDNADSEKDLIKSLLFEVYITAKQALIEYPREIIVPVLPDDLDYITALISEEAQHKVKIRVPLRLEKKDLLDYASKNAKNSALLFHKKREKDIVTRSNALNDIQRYLNLKGVPYRLECYDISHLQTTNRVASMVVFEDGMPKKQDYRHFVIKNIYDDRKRDDTQAMHETLTRRLAYLKENAEKKDDSFSKTPDLFIIDGGKPQLGAALLAYKESGLKGLQFCALAKRIEEVFLPNQEDSVLFERGSDALFTFQNIRDEAHRFAITHHRTRRTKAQTTKNPHNL